MMLVFLGTLHLDCAFVLQDSTQICFSRAVAQECCRALEEKGFFLHFTALLSVRMESSKFLRMLFCNLKMFFSSSQLSPRINDKPWEALLTCCIGLK